MGHILLKKGGRYNMMEQIRVRIRILLGFGGESNNDFHRGYRIAVRDCQNIIESEIINARIKAKKEKRWK